ncbi:hypothetical protein [Sediminitomix flava]|uniref:ABC transporter ATPase n=1 Tax=Sediminitomix flava TaxID=379075 RepID=A0A315ZAF5_SEDFL|nr:hypothetical protein [Sediminitomix flava]PWJ42139.1 hypothetical protein BC781_103389 [Sediminitomix flava]
MYKEINTISPSSKVWIYQASRELTQDEQKDIQIALRGFVESWQTHGAPVFGSCDILYKRFLLILAEEDQNAPSGCSIDSSVGLIREIENKYQITLLDRSQIALMNTDGDIFTKGLNELKEAVSSGEISEETTVFNNTITNYQSFESSWKQKASESWMKKYFKN